MSEMFEREQNDYLEKVIGFLKQHSGGHRIVEIAEATRLSPDIVRGKIRKLLISGEVRQARYRNIDYYLMPNKVKV